MASQPEKQTAATHILPDIQYGQSDNEIWSVRKI